MYFIIEIYSMPVFQTKILIKYYLSIFNSTLSMTKTDKIYIKIKH